MTPQTLAAIRILALVAAYRERFGDVAAYQLVIDLGREAKRRPDKGSCQRCGCTIEQHRKGRPRKYCLNCVALIGHRSPTSKTPKEKVDETIRHKPRRGKRKQRIPRWLRADAFERDNYQCLVCGSTENLSIDHIIPECDGGTLWLGNVQTLCRTCNSKKGRVTKDHRSKNRK